METETIAPTSCAIEFSKDIGEICGALAKAQAKIESAERDAENPYFGSSYSSLAAVWDAVRGPLTENSLSILQGEKTRIKPDLTGGEVDVTTMLLHSSGQWFRTTVTLPVIPMSSRKNRGGDSDNDVDRVGGRITPQAIGSAITYGRRYGLESVTGTAPEAKEDDDGNSASGAERVEPIPAGGAFEDVIESVTFETKPKKAGGTFVVAVVKTGKHGALECWENIGQMAQPHAGTGIACALKAERGKYGPRLLDVQPIQAPAGDPAPNLNGAPNWKSWALQELSLCTTQDHIALLKEELKKRNWFNEETKALLKAKAEQLTARQAPAEVAT